MKFSLLLAAALFSSASAWSLTLVEHAAQGTVWELRDATARCPAFVTVTFKDVVQRPSGNNPRELAGDGTLVVNKFEDAGLTQKADSAFAWYWPYRPNLTRGRAVLDSHSEFPLFSMSYAQNADARSENLSLKVSMIVVGSMHEQLKLNKRSGDLTLSGKKKVTEGPLKLQCAYRVRG